MLVTTGFFLGGAAGLPICQKTLSNIALKFEL